MRSKNEGSKMKLTKITNKSMFVRPGQFFNKR
jgi:hypothetical protein